MRIKLSAWAKQEGIAYRTAVSHFHAGLIPEAFQKTTGTIMVDIPDKVEPVSLIGKNRVVLYSRVSSSQNKDNLVRQQARLEDFAAAKGYQIVRNVKEVGSGLNDNRTQLNKILTDPDWDVLLVEHRDRLTRFGFNHLELLLNQLDKRIEVINASEDKDDLIQDFISVITSFSARIYGRRRTHRQTERLIEELNVTKND